MSRRKGERKRIWRELCLRVFARDNYTCQHCGYKGQGSLLNLVCYVVERKNFLHEHMEDCITWCQRCSREQYEASLEAGHPRKPLAQIFVPSPLSKRATTPKWIAEDASLSLLTDERRTAVLANLRAKKAAHDEQARKVALRQQKSSLPALNHTQ